MLNFYHETFIYVVVLIISLCLYIFMLYIILTIIQKIIKYFSDTKLNVTILIAKLTRTISRN